MRRTVEGWGNKLAGALGATATKELTEALGPAAAALGSGKIAGSWSAVKDASVRLGRSASNAGLAKVASLIAETGIRGPQQQPGGRLVPVIEQAAAAPQAPPPGPQQAGGGPRQIPVIDLAQDAAQQAQQAQQQEVQQVAAAQGSGLEPDVLASSPPFDAPMADAAVAQEAVAGQAAAATPGTTAAGGVGNNPEHLYPPGRIIWWVWRRVACGGRHCCWWGRGLIAA